MVVTDNKQLLDGVFVICGIIKVEVIIDGTVNGTVNGADYTAERCNARAKPHAVATQSEWP
jgi:hypothetical protein